VHMALSASRVDIFPAGDVHFIVKRNTCDDHGVCEGREEVQRHNTWGIAIARTVFAKTSFANHAASRPPMPDMVALQRSGVKKGGQVIVRSISPVVLQL
jgi:hypothetical protein